MRDVMGKIKKVPFVASACCLNTLGNSCFHFSHCVADVPVRSGLRALCEGFIPVQQVTCLLVLQAGASFWQRRTGLERLLLVLLVILLLIVVILACVLGTRSAPPPAPHPVYSGHIPGQTAAGGGQQGKEPEKKGLGKFHVSFLPFMLRPITTQMCLDVQDVWSSAKVHGKATVNGECLNLARQFSLPAKETKLFQHSVGHFVRRPVRESHFSGSTGRLA